MVYTQIFQHFKGYDQLRSALAILSLMVHKPYYIRRIYNFQEKCIRNIFLCRCISNCQLSLHIVHCDHVSVIKMIVVDCLGWSVRECH